MTHDKNKLHEETQTVQECAKSVHDDASLPLETGLSREELRIIVEEMIG